MAVRATIQSIRRLPNNAVLLFVLTLVSGPAGIAWVASSSWDWFLTNEPRPVVETYVTEPDGRNRANGRILTPVVQRETPDGTEIDVPVRLAIRNAGRRGLAADRVLIGYPPGIDVRGSGNGVQDPLRNRFSYEKPVGPLESRGAWRFLPIDTLKVRVTRIENQVIGLSADGNQMPFYTEALVFTFAARERMGPGWLNERAVSLHVTVINDDGTTTQDDVTVELPPFYGDINVYGFAPSLEYPLADPDAVIRPFREAPLVRGPLTTTVKGVRVVYQERESELFRAQVVFRNASVMAVFVDDGKDGDVDRQILIARNGTGHELQFRPPVLWRSWQDRAFH